MSGILTIDKGSGGNWWLSPDIWVLPQGSANTGPPGVTPIAGSSYDVWVRVRNNYQEPTDGNWALYIEWAIPTTGNYPIVAAEIISGNVVGSVVDGVPLGTSVAANSYLDVKSATPWVPIYENGGHECLIAVVYNAGSIGTFPVHPGGPLGSLNGDDAGNFTWQIAQHNLGVVSLTGGKSAHFQYPIRIGNIAATEHEFVVVARQAPLSEITPFLPSVPHGEAVLHHPGKVEKLGIVTSAHPGERECEAAQPKLDAVKIAPGGHHKFTLSGTLREGNALIHVTQHLGERAVGGLSVLVLGEVK